MAIRLDQIGSDGSVVIPQQQQTNFQQQPSSLPPEVQAIVNQMGRGQQSVSIPLVGGGRITQSGVSPQDELLKRVAEKKIDQLYQAPDANERERAGLTRSASDFLDSFASQLGLNPSTNTMANPEKLAKPFMREFVSPKLQDYVMPEDTSMLYSDLDSAFTVGALALTGRAGDIQKLQQLQNTYTFGAGIKNKPRLANKRLQNLKNLFGSLDHIQTLPQNKRGPALDQVSQMMSSMLKDEKSAESNQPTNSPAQLSPDEDAIVKRLLGGK